MPPWTPVLDDIQTRKRIADNRWRRHGCRRGWEELERLTWMLKHMERRERRRRERIHREEMLRAPLGEKVKALKTDKRNRQRYIECARRSGRQMAPKAFSRHLEMAHDQACYPAPWIRTFFPTGDFNARVKTVINKENGVKLSGQMEYIQRCSRQLPMNARPHSLDMVGESRKISMFPDQWKEGILCPL